MSQTVVGIFSTAAEANNAVSQLMNYGFNEEDVDVKSGSATGDYSATSASSTDGNEGSVSRFFKNLFSSDDESDRYTNAAQKGTVVTVHAQSTEQAEQAATLLDQYGAADIDDDSYGNTGTMYNNDTVATDSSYKNDTDQTISVIEETMQVGKRNIQTGGVRIKSRIVEKPVEASLRLREEHVNIERTKVNRVVTDADLQNFQGNTIEVTEYAEVPVVSKEARVVEEISVGKKVNERQETIKDTVRKTEVDIDDQTTKNLN